MNSVIGGVILRIIINKGIISHLCIDPRYQGKGYAKLLLDYLIQYVSSNHNEIEYLQLIVGSVWKNAISLYKKLGFKIIKVEAHLPRT